MSFLVAAYAVLWAVSFGLIVSMFLRQRKAEQELQALSVIIEDESRSEYEG